MKKNNSLLKLLFCAFFFLITGCTPMATMPKKNDYITMETHPSIEENTESGLVYFFREKNNIGLLITYFIYDGEQKIGLLRKGSYFIHKANQGQHTYMAKTEGRGVVTITVEAGKKYYVFSGVRMGLISNPFFDVVTEEYALPYLSELEHIKLKNK